MAQSVDRLKELLFDNEARAFNVLAQRVEGAERRVDEIFSRAGSTERFEASVAEVLDGALRKAEIERHTELASAMAPLVVRTVKTEIRNSRDELVEALYPMTGRMVQAYVASAMKDLANDINRRLEQNPVMLRLRSLGSGKSVAEIAIADSQRLLVEELYLIRRGSGELVGRWPEAEAGAQSRDHVMSGVLTAINEFSTEALKDDGSALRQIDLGERQLYLRVSPSFLLAAKCSGSASQPVEMVLDQSFLEAMEGLQNLSASGDHDQSAQRTAILAGLSQNLEQKLDEKTGELATQAAGISPLKILTWMIAIPVIGWLSWMIYADYQTQRAHSIASTTLAAHSELNGYPVSLDVSQSGSQITVSGLAPALAVKDVLLLDLRTALPRSDIVDRLSVLPNALAMVEPRLAGVTQDVKALAPELARARDDIADVTRDFGALAPELARARRDIATVDPKIDSVRERLNAVETEFQASTMRREMERSHLQLRAAQDAVAALATAPGAPLNDAELRRASASIDLAIKALAGLRAAAGDASIAVVSGHIQQAQTSVAALAGLTLPPPQPLASGASNGDTKDISADGLAAQADRLASVALAAVQVIAVKRSLPTPVEISPRERLLSYAKSNAIFFTNETDFRNAAQANVALDELAALLNGNDLTVRVVGYTDNQGTPERNLSLSEARSGAVIEALKQRGIVASRLVKLARVDAVGISPERGPLSPNRRVEFEVGFVGEAGP